MSKGENKIVDLLNQARIRFEREKTFSDLRGGRYRYDFYVDPESKIVVHGKDKHPVQDTVIPSIFFV